jgi:propanol-preferring alcohol dehydrogenase
LLNLVCLDNCLEGGETSCPSGTISGYLTPGTFQQFCLAPAAYVTLIPEGIDLAGAAPLMCGGVTVYAALKRANVRHGQWVVILGAGGGLGHLAIQYAKALGAKVVAIDAGSKQTFCLDLGAEAFIDFTMFESDVTLAEHVQQITGNGAKVALVCSASNRAYAQAVSFLGFRGVLACLGVPEGKPVPIEGAIVGDLVAKELVIFGMLLASQVSYNWTALTKPYGYTASKSGNRLEIKECLDIAASGKVRTHYQLQPMDSLAEVNKFLDNFRCIANPNRHFVI